ADVVGVVALHLRGVQRVARKNAVVKARRETLDLRLDARGHVHIAAAGDVAVRPGGVLACWCARWIEEALLRQQDKRSLRDNSSRDVTLCRGHLRQRPAYVNRPRAQAGRITPGDGAI